MRSFLRRVTSIARNDLRIELSDRSTWLFYLVLPLMFTAILGAATGGSGSAAIGLSVADVDQSAVSAQLVVALRDQSGLAINVTDPAAGTSEGRRLTIPAGFGAALLAGRTPQLDLGGETGDNGDVAVRQSIGAATGQVTAAVTAARVATDQAGTLRPFASDADRAAFFAAALRTAEPLAAAPPLGSVVTTAPTSAPVASGYSQQSPGELVTWGLITLLGISEVFVSERLGGTLRRLLVTPNRPITIILGKVTGRYALGLLQMALLIGIGGAVFNVAWGRSPVALAMVVMAFALAAVALGMVLGAVARTRQQAVQLTILSSMLLAALGGAWFPIEVAPDAFRAAASVLPTTWAMAGFSAVIMQGAGPAAVLPWVLLLVGFAVACFAVASRRLRLD